VGQGDDKGGQARSVCRRVTRRPVNRGTRGLLGCPSPFKFVVFAL
jgi:hypothetical protein